ncbi:hypothetical protein SAMN05443292_0014 [Halpernia frigidisoli]|uniref:Uncharacterized protein n=2 Tax=Halpernia frigidisoli TaxID=1125876 RepID=A0A1I3CR89_9FLAO|nr:hypothetical protein SAMN05443292_0014 [Halpernia frigidisoli]
MKLKIFTLLFILFSAFIFAQNKSYVEDQAIRKSVVYFANTIKYKKLDKTVDCLYPKFFTVFPKNKMTQLLNMTYDNPFAKIDILDMKFASVGKPELIDGEYFSIVSYYLKMKADVSQMNEDMKKMISNVLISKYGKDNVNYLDKDGTYNITAPTKVCAISSDKKSWKLVPVEREFKSQLVKVLPKSILDRL